VFTLFFVSPNHIKRSQTQDSTTTASFREYWEKRGSPFFQMAGFSFLVSILLAVQAYTVSAQTPTIIPNIDDPNAVNAQKVCPGYKASSVKNTATGFTATLTLAGPACNVYGMDVGSLGLTVEYQAQDRLGVNIVPSHYDASNESWYILPESLVPKPSASATASGKSDFAFTWSNEPSFNFQVIRKATGDILFNTAGSVLVFENQFLEFVTSVPENYNVYGLSEHMHALRLGNNFTSTSWNVDIGDPIDG
jgi:alpha-glucosidase